MADRQAFNAEEIVAQALNYLVAHEPMLMRFFNLTGLTADTIREAAGSASFPAAVLDHFLADETLLAQFSQFSGIRSEDIRNARLRLEGGVPSEKAERALGPSQPRRPLFR
jgi:hypothetical protein